MKPLKIAVVDDDQIYQFIVNRTLTKLQPESKILNFSNCADFFNFLKRNSANASLLPDLVLLDINTPFMSGWEFLENYSELKPLLSKEFGIYIVTSSVDPNDELKASETSLLDGFFTKPLKPAELMEVITKNELKKF